MTEITPSPSKEVRVAVLVEDAFVSEGYASEAVIYLQDDHEIVFQSVSNDDNYVMLTFTELGEVLDKLGVLERLYNAQESGSIDE